MPAAEEEPSKTVLLAPQAGRSYWRPAPAGIAGIEARTMSGWTDFDLAKPK